MNEIINCFELVKRLARNHKLDYENFTHLPTLSLFDKINPVVVWNRDNIIDLYKKLSCDAVCRTDIPEMIDRDKLPEYFDMERLDPNVQLFVKLFSIPIYDPPNLQNLLLIAETIGILSTKLNDMKVAFTKFFIENEMDKLDTYLLNIRFTDEDIKLIKQYTDQLEDNDVEVVEELDKYEDVNIPGLNRNGDSNSNNLNEQVYEKIKFSGGGNQSYYDKYLIYKAKYLALKDRVK